MRILFFVIFSVGSLLCQVSLGEDALRQAVESIAKRTVQLMEQRGVDSVTVLGVEDGTTYGATSASGIEKMLKDEFTRLGKFKESRGEVGLKGKLLTAKPPVPQGTSEGFAEMLAGIRNLKIELQFTDMDGEPLPSFNGEYFLDRPDQTTVDQDTRLGRDGRKKDAVRVQRATFGQEIENAEALFTAFGANGKFEGKSADTLKAPISTITRDNIAKVSDENDFGVRVISGGRVKPLRMVEGQPFVDFELGEEFTIDVINGSKGHVAATLTVDGLNTFYFSKTPQAHGTSWIIPPPSRGESWANLPLEGWYVRQGVADKFVATSFEKSKRREAGLDADSIGAISVVFSSAVNATEPSYVVEVPQKVELLTVDGERAETDVIVKEQRTRTVTVFIGGNGEVQQKESKPSDFKPGWPLEIVTIRYRHPRA